MSSKYYQSVKARGHTVLEGYLRLANAIINRGVREHDELFLRSQWFDELRGAVGQYFCDGPYTADLSRGRHVQFS